MGLLSLLVVVSVPSILSNQMFYFYPGYVGQPGRSPFLPKGPVVNPYSLPLQTDINTFSPQSMGNRSTIIIIIQFYIIIFLENMNSYHVKPTKATGKYYHKLLTAYYSDVCCLTE